jgi:hypothetical protein
MTARTLKALRFALSAVTGLGCLFVNDNLSSTRTFTLSTQADARIGNPLTPGSVAGVARRTTRRAVRRGAIGATAVGAGAYYGASSYYGAPYNYGAYGYGASAATAVPAAEPAASYGGPGYGPGPVPGSVIVNPATGRWCTFEPSGWHWCWTP